MSSETDCFQKILSISFLFIETSPCSPYEQSQQGNEKIRKRTESKKENVKEKIEESKPRKRDKQKI